MSEKELSQYYYLKREIEHIESKLAEFGYGVGATKYSDINVKGTQRSVSLQEKIAELIDIYEERRVSALEQYLKIENYIKTVDDPEIRMIMEHRFLDLKKWHQIDRIMHYSPGYSKVKYYRYNKKTKNDNI